MPGETPSQPGWYPDQNGTMRWFDGAAWTDHVQPGAGGVAGAGPTMVQPGTPDPTQRLEQQPGWQGGLPPASPPAGPPAGPPSGPPPGSAYGAPGSAYGAVPQPSFPGGPGGPGGPPPGFPPPSSGGSNKGLLIILAVVGAVVLIAVLAVGSWAIFVRDSDDSDSGSSGSSSLPDTEPEEVVEAYVEAIKSGDCEAALDLLSAKFIAEEEANCEDDEDFMSDEEFDYEVGDATIDEDAETASVPFSVSAEGYDEEFPILMVVEGGEWKIDSFDIPVPTDIPTDIPTDTPTDIPTDLPTDLPTDIPTDLTDFTDFPTDFTDFPTDFPTDPSELESYLSDYFSEFLTFTG